MNFRQLLVALDVALTGKPFARAVKTQNDHSKEFNEDPETWFLFGTDVYYLSDGGYSRIGFNEETSKLFITSNSLDKPKELWDTCGVVIALRREIEMRIMARVQQLHRELEEERAPDGGA